MVFQGYALYPHMTVRENMSFALAGQGREGRDPAACRAKPPRRSVDQALGSKASPPIGRAAAKGRARTGDCPRAAGFSDGRAAVESRRRAAIQMRVEIARLQQHLGTTTVYVTHDQIEAMTLGHRVAVMRDGLIQQVDTPRTLYSEPANIFVAGFIGSPRMNLVPARIEGGADRDSLRQRRAARAAALGALYGGSTGSLLAGMRPEHIDDAALTSQRGAQLRFRARVDLVESMGSELYLHFGAAAEPQTKEALMGDLPTDGTEKGMERDRGPRSRSQAGPPSARRSTSASTSSD